MLRPSEVWTLKVHPPEKLQRLQSELGLRRPTAQALLAHGLENLEEVKAFLEPSFDNWLKAKSFVALKKGAQLLLDKVKAGKRICVHGDFDSDGVLATVIFCRFFEAVGFSCTSFIPSREHGHGISANSVREIAKTGAELIVTVDCGISATDAANTAKELGIELIITDHHLPDNELPEALALVNAQIEDDAKDFRTYSGAAISLKLCLEIASLLPPAVQKSQAFESFLHHALVLAAISTIADVMPLRADNRALVSQALGMTQSLTWPGLKVLFTRSGLGSNLTAESIAFQLVPRLNAAQRMGRGELVWKLFTATNEQEARETFSELNRLNDQRKSHQGEHTQLVLTRLAQELDKSPVPPAIIFSGTSWREGISGLIASKVMEQYGVPTMIIRIEDALGQASCRAPQGFHLKDALDSCAELLVSYGGHRGAAGFRIEENKLEAFKEKMLCVMEKQRQALSSSGIKTQLCGELAWHEIDDALVDELNILEPYGHKNSKPIFGSRGISMDGRPVIMGKEGLHAKLRFHRQGSTPIETMGFFMGNFLKNLDPYSTYDIAFNVGRSRYNQRIQLNLVAIRPHQRKV